MIRKIISAFLFFVVFQNVFGQNFNCTQISFSSVNSAESKTMPMSFLNKYFSGDFIDSTSKWSAINNLNSKNYLGFFSNNRLKFNFESDKKLSYYLAISNQNLLGIGFTNNFFQLVFAGNNSLLGTHVSMNPAEFRQFSFSEIKAGISFSIMENIQVFAALGPVLANSCNSISFSKSAFYTSQNADSVSAKINGSFLHSSSYALIKGFGLSAEIGIKGYGKNYEWAAGISNIGRVGLNRRTVSTNRDTLFSFSGFKIDDFSNFEGGLSQQFDDLENTFSLKGDTANNGVWLPIMLFAECKIQTGRLISKFGFLYYRLPDFIPYIQYAPSLPISDNWLISLPLKIGGYGPFNAGLGFECKISKSIKVSAEFPSVLSALNINNNTSLNASLKLIYKKEK